MTLYEPSYFEPNGKRTADCDGAMTWDSAIGMSHKFPSLYVHLKSHFDGHETWLRAGYVVPAPDFASAKHQAKPHPRVCVTRCERCGLEHTMFARFTGHCPRCKSGPGYQFSRWLTHPHPDTVAQAERETADR